jgi:AcrR family transcriptional regulator
MDGDVNPQKRPYDSSRRRAGAARTREAIVRAALSLFEQVGWSGTTVSAVSSAAGVSPKSVEAVFGTKAALLKAAVDFAISGDFDSRPIVRREAVAAMEAAPTAAEMLGLHAHHLSAINARSARIARAVEQAAPVDTAVAELWADMNANRAFAVRWACDTLLAKPGCRHRLTRHDVEAAIWVALDWGTFRTLTELAGLSVEQFEQWLNAYYVSMLVASDAAT